MLKNRVYLGEIQHGETSFPADHPPIIPAELFEQMQAQLAANRRARKERPTRSSRLPLSGKVFDADDHPMSPSFGYGRAGEIYRYYVSAPVQQGRKLGAGDGALRRVNAQALDDLIRDQLAEFFETAGEVDLHELLRPVRRVQITSEEVRILLDRSGLSQTQQSTLQSCDDGRALGLLIAPVRCQVRGGRTWLITPAGAVPRKPRRDPTLIKGLRQAHRIAAGFGWRSADGGLASVKVTAPTSSHERKLCRLAFLAPDIQRAILEGRQPLV